MIAKRIDQLRHTLSRRTFPEDLRDLAELAPQAPRFVGMNKQFMRAGIVMKLLNGLPFDAFVETGTHKGSTSLLVAAQTALPILSCEVNKAFLRSARRRLFFFRSRIKLFNSDSREFLRTVLADHAPRCPFIYLDSHWLDDLPLKGELAIIRELTRDCVVMIDDFQVPFDPGFGWDTYGEVDLEWSYIESELESFPRPVSVFYPSYPSSTETGSRRGWILIACGSLAESVPRIVPSTLLRSFPSIPQDETKMPKPIEFR